MKRTTIDSRTALRTLAAALALGPAVGVHAEDNSFAGVAVSDAIELDSLRAQSGNTSITVQSNQDLSANVTGGTFNVGTMNNGAVNFDAQALDNFGGVGLFNIVTGNNNAVNAAIGITFNLQ